MTFVDPSTISFFVIIALDTFVVLAVTALTYLIKHCNKNAKKSSIITKNSVFRQIHYNN
jgi:hypothetical protein